MITLTDPTANTNLQNVFKQSHSIRMSLGCTIEYNMNMLTNLSASSITGPSYAKPGNKDAFKKIFPLDTIIRPRRPEKAGVKYAIVGDISPSFSTATKSGGDYVNPKNTTYPYSFRTYYPGIETAYKYWVSNEGQGGTITVSYPKTIVTNKIVVKFEISHAIPPTWTVYGTPVGGSEGTLATGTSSDIPTFLSTTSNPGVLTLYYTGTAWTTNASLHNTSAYVSLTATKLVFGGVANKYIGVIEFSPRWVIDVSDRIQSVDIQKEASDSVDSILPVGKVTANSVNITMIDYNQSAKQIVGYEKANTFAIDPLKVYLYKQIEVKPFFKVFHDNGTLGSGSDKYDKIDQGTFYIDSFSIDEFGRADMFALDGAKILQETLCPNILCEQYASTAIIRRLLDNIGLTNYNFNLTANDQSVISPNYWWSDGSKTVWEAIQELCRDTQMTAVFDHNNVLQFYSREYMYTARATDWVFTSETIDTTTLPNIISLTKEELPSANQVKVLWQTATTSNYERNAYVIWKSGTKVLTASALAADLAPVDVQDGVVAGGGSTQYLTLASISEFSPYTDNAVLDDFNTYIAIGEEIIELDAIEYFYVPITAPTTKVQVDITSAADILKYKALSMPGAENFQPTGRYRIKNRKAFGTSFPKDANGNPTAHPASTSTQLAGWETYEVVYK